jgi:hypothetical protein
MANIPSQLDNLNVVGIQQGTIKLFSDVARELQIQNGSTATGWVNTIQQLNDIVLADSLRSLTLQDTDTIRYSADDVLNRGSGNVVNQIAVETISSPIPTNISITGGIPVNSYQVLIPEKRFYSNVIGFGANVDSLYSYINSTLDNNNTYANSNVVTSVQYAINNGYVSSWTALNASNFDLSPNTQDIQDLAEEKIAKLKTAFLNNNFLG